MSFSVLIRTVVEDICSTSAPISERILSAVEMSLTSGIFSSVQTPLMRMVAKMIGNAAFFIPLIEISPDRGIPPRMMIFVDISHHRERLVAVSDPSSRVYRKYYNIIFWK